MSFWFNYSCKSLKDNTANVCLLMEVFCLNKGDKEKVIMTTNIVIFNAGMVYSIWN